MTIKYLICGNYNVFMLSLIGRLRKEKEDVFVITGTRENKKNKCQGVFQQYHFDFESRSIGRVIESVQPDFIIFTAALNDIEEKSEQNAVHFIAGLTNLLISSKKMGVKNFVYLSAESGISEEKDSIVKLGQEICENFKNDEEHQIIIANLGEIYGCYKKITIQDSIVTKLCEKILNRKPLNGDKEKLHNMIYVEDAVDRVFRILHIKEGIEKKYAINGNRDYTEEEIYNTLAKIGAGKLKGQGKNNSKKSDKNRAQGKEDGFLSFEKYSFEDGLERVYIGMSANFVPEESTFVRENKMKNIISRMRVRNRYIPFLENMVFFALLQFIVSLTRDAAIYETIDLYLLYVVLFGVTYGMTQAVFSVALSVLGRFYIMLTSQGILMLFEEYNKYLWILQIFTIGVIVGYLKDKYRKKIRDYAEEEEYLKTELNNLIEINKSNMEVKDVYEGRLLSYKDSFVNIYEIVQQLDDMESYKVVFNTISVVCKIVGSKDVAIYMCDKYEKYARLLAASSEYGRSKGKSIELAKFQDMHVKIKNQEIYTNGSLSADYPILAGGTYEDGSLKMIIAIWTLPYENNNLNQVNTFSIACKLVDRTLTRAYRYMESISKDTHIGETGVLTKDAFANILNLYDYGYKKGFLKYSVLKITSFSLEQKEFYNRLKVLIRDTDYAGESQELEVCLLLTNTEKEEADFVLQRLKEQGIHAELLSVG